MANNSGSGKQYSRSAMKKIRKRASEIWKRKCLSLNTALDDWLQAERELRATIGIQNKSPEQYANEDIARIKERAQAIRESKVQSLRTAFDDWIEAEQELKEELEKKVDLKDLFDRWFSKASPRVASLLEADATARASVFDDALGQQYIELMADCMK